MKKYKIKAQFKISHAIFVILSIFILSIFLQITAIKTAKAQASTNTSGLDIQKNVKALQNRVQSLEEKTSNRILILTIVFSILLIATVNILIFQKVKFASINKKLADIKFNSDIPTDLNGVEEQINSLGDRISVLSENLELIESKLSETISRITEYESRKAELIKSEFSDFAVMEQKVPVSNELKEAKKIGVSKKAKIINETDISDDSKKDAIDEEEKKIMELCILYNSAIDDPQKQNEFWKQYNPERFGIHNIIERRKDPDIRPIFQKTDNGDYLLLNLNSDFVVVPKHNLDFNQNVYRLSAMGEIFECPKFNRDLIYRSVKIVNPAYFEPESEDESSWRLKKTGELDLGKGE
jgi:ribosomal protein S13